MTSTATIGREKLDRIVQSYLDGRSSDEEVDFLEANHPLWTDSLWRLLERADAAFEAARQTVNGPERNSVLNDLEDDCDRIDDLLADLLGPLETPRPGSRGHRRWPRPAATGLEPRPDHRMEWRP